jgi:hypothetical protein
MLKLGLDWLPGRTTVFNAQVLNSAAYCSVTGVAPPTEPIDAATYARNGLPFFKMYEEPSGIHGKFSAVKSVTAIDKTKEKGVEPRTVRISSSVGIINCNGPLSRFRTARDLEKEYSGYHVAQFWTHFGSMLGVKEMNQVPHVKWLILVKRLHNMDFQR